MFIMLKLHLLYLLPFMTSREFLATAFDLDVLLFNLNNVILTFHRHLRPSMMQQLLRRLVFDVPMLTDYCKIPLRVRHLTRIAAALAL